MVVLINGKKFQAEYLTKPEEIQKGMMGRDSLDGCMVFKMKVGYHSFWMKNCLIPIDIVFVNKNIISGIHLNCPPHKDETVSPTKYNGIGDTVIEFPSNTAKDWKIGDKVNGKRQTINFGNFFSGLRGGATKSRR
jgi:uncharacterized membrane protein (UPF0127 family)